MIVPDTRNTVLLALLKYSYIWQHGAKPRRAQGHRLAWCTLCPASLSDLEIGWGTYFVLKLLFTPRTLGLWRRGVACGYPRAETGLRVQIVR